MAFSSSSSRFCFRVKPLPRTRASRASRFLLGLVLASCSPVSFSALLGRLARGHLDGRTADQLEAELEIPSNEDPRDVQTRHHVVGRVLHGLDDLGPRLLGDLMPPPCLRGVLRPEETLREGRLDRVRRDPGPIRPTAPSSPARSSWAKY